MHQVGSTEHNWLDHHEGASSEQPGADLPVFMDLNPIRLHFALRRLCSGKRLHASSDHTCMQETDDRLAQLVQSLNGAKGSVTPYQLFACAVEDIFPDVNHIR